MCLEDLRLGRGRKIQKPVVIAADNATHDILPADPNRVAILISFGGGAVSTGNVSDNAQLFTDAGGGMFQFMSLPSNVDPVELRIEDFGNLVTSKITGNLTSASAGYPSTFTATAVITSVKADPLGN